jgi:hypothetical protein
MSRDDLPGGSYKVAIRELDRADADKTRAEIVRRLSREIVEGLKAKLDPASYVNSGWAEYDTFVEALCNGGMHPALTEWEEK